MRSYPIVKVAFPGLVFAAVCLFPTPSPAQDSQAIRVGARTGTALQGHAMEPSGNSLPQPPAGVITLDPPSGLDLQAHAFKSNGEPLPPVPANFQRLGEASVGQVADLHTLTLRFSQTAKITGISISKDFKIEQGGSCVERNVYQKGSTCRLLVRFTPQGPGNRLGKLTVANTASPTPDFFGLGGIGASPVVSFVPSIITTVPGTYPASVGLLTNAQSLTVDGGDVLYVADFGNDQIREIDSSGVLKSFTPYLTNPVSIAVDTQGEVWGVGASGSQYYFSVNSLLGAAAFQYTYTYSTCTIGAPCDFSSVGMGYPAHISIDSYNNLFMEEETTGVLEMPISSYFSALKLWHLADWYAYEAVNPGAFAVNPSSNTLFTSFTFSSANECGITAEPLIGADYNNPTYTRVAGANDCGFSGDGGLGANAEIGSAVGQFAFDAAGDLYFTDTKNQRVRRIDYNTGIIRTVAGNGTAGYIGDGIGSVGAELASPTGVAVDSQGQIYIISGAAATGTAQVIRKVTTVGYRNFGTVVKGTKATFTPIIVTNTGNSEMQITNTSFTGPNASEFAIDPTATTCMLTPGAILASGQSCQIAFTATPAATGLRTAYFNLLDNSVTGVNVVDLHVTGKLLAATFKISSPSNGASYTSGTAVPFNVSVTSASGPAPTGTVQFKVDAVNHGSPVTLVSGAASTSLTGLSTTTHALSATYSGDSNYAAGGPISVSITVTGSVPPPAVRLMPLMSTATSCGPMSFQATVDGKAGSVPTGAVQLMNGQSQIASGTLAGGKAVLTAPPLHPGTYAFTAHYGGDAHNQPAVSPELVQTASPLGGCLRQEGSVR
jgi:hypothetical protein